MPTPASSMTLVVQASKPVMMETSMHKKVVGSRQMAPVIRRSWFSLRERGRASSGHGSRGDNATDLDKWPASRTSTRHVANEYPSHVAQGLSSRHGRGDLSIGHHISHHPNVDPKGKAIVEEFQDTAIAWEMGENFSCR